MKNENKQKVIDFLKDKSNNIDFEYLLKDNDFEKAEDIRELLENENAFDINIIYYSNAINFLREHDCSLRESLEIANELGYTVEKLNSELLASLLASQIERDNFSKLTPELEDFMQELTETEEAE